MTLHEKSVARPLKEGFHSFCGEQNQDEIPAGDGSGGAKAEPQ
ncbi:hypothetical protein [uncultured Rikenella sp.]|nr:hypothetical protein [uncultured Rikenella sp.]